MLAAELAGCVLHTPAASAGRDKSSVKRKEGIRSRIRMESGESLTCTGEGVAKARVFGRKPENAGSWIAEECDKFTGISREPCPEAKGGFEHRSNARLPAESREFTKTAMGKTEFTPRRCIIRKEDLDKFGHVTGCPGCRAAKRAEERRKRIAEELEKA